MDKHKKYNHSDKGLARYATYRRKHWTRIEAYEQVRNRLRREARIAELQA